MRFCGACIITNNVSKLSDFYSSIFNTMPEGDENHVAFDNMNLAIWNPGLVANDVCCSPMQPGNSEISKVKNMSLMYFVDDAKYEYQRLLKINGIEMVSEPEMQPWGVIAFSFKDPDGNEINFIQKLNKV